MPIVPTKDRPLNMPCDDPEGCKHFKAEMKLQQRIKGLEAALQGMVPFIEEDFPDGTGTNHGTCATDQYQQACDAVIKVLKGE